LRMKVASAFQDIQEMRKGLASAPSKASPQQMQDEVMVMREKLNSVISENARLHIELDEARSENNQLWSKVGSSEQTVSATQDEHARILVEYTEHLEQLRGALADNAIALAEKDARLSQLSEADHNPSSSLFDDSRVSSLLPLDLRPAHVLQDEASIEAKSAVEVLHRRARGYVQMLHSTSRESEYISYEEAVALKTQVYDLREQLTALQRDSGSALVREGGRKSPNLAMDTTDTMRSLLLPNIALGAEADKKVFKGRYRMRVVHPNGHVSMSLEVTKEERERERLLLEHYETQIRQLNSQLQLADAKCVEFHSECEKLATALAQERQTRTALEPQAEQLRRELATTRDELETTRENYSQQMRVLTDHVCDLQTSLDNYRRSKAVCSKCRGPVK